jgi:hypothetical protein
MPHREIGEITEALSLRIHREIREVRELFLSWKTRFAP